MEIENTELENQEEKKLNLQVDVQEQGACGRRVKIVVSRQDVDEALDAEYAVVQQEQAIPGFRPGKAPKKLIEKRFRKEVVERVKNQLVLKALEQAGEEQNMTPISEPEINLGAVILPEEGDFIFEYNIEVRPKFDIPNWKGLKIERPTREFSAEDVDAAVKRIQASYAKLETKNGGAENGDFVVCQLTFERDGEVVSQAPSERLRVRSKLSFHDGYVPEFDVVMAGAKAGDTRKAKFKFSDDLDDEKLRGQEIDAIFDVKEVLVAVLPELDEEFLDAVGGFETVGDFRDAVLETLNRQLEYEQSQRARKQIAALLTVGASWELPPKLLKEQSERELRRIAYELQRSQFSNEQIVAYLNRQRQNSYAATAQALKEHFILEAIAESENIEAEERDYEAEIRLIAQQEGTSPRRVRAAIEKNGNWDVLRNQVVERKVIQKIKDAADFVDVPYNLDEVFDEEAAVDIAARPAQSNIPEVSEEDAKEAAREQAEGKK